MAASTSKSPKSATKPLRPSSNKGKGKENISKPSQTNSSTCDARNYDDVAPWHWTSLTDPSSTRIPPLFTKDGNYFFSLVGSSVKIYSSVTGLVVSTLTTPPTIDEQIQSDVLTSIVLNPHNAFQLITGSLDGRVMIWDFVNATLLQTINLGQPIHFICTHEQFKDSIFVAASRARKKAVSNDNNAVVLRVSLKQSDHTSQAVELAPVGKIRFPTGLAISPNGAWLVASAGHKIYVAKTSSLSSGFTKYVSPERLRCLAFHPFEEYFATGDDKGVIRLWYCLNDNLAVNVRGVEKRTQTRSLHWHAHAVSSVSFTHNGAYLLSGGEESVLVVWQLHTGKKEFVPRLGSQISTISVLPASKGEEEYLIGLVDATYTFISSASLKVTRSYSRIKIDPTLSQEWPSTSKSYSAPLAVQPLTAALVLPSSHPSSLQMYSPSTSTLLGELEVSPSNRVSRRDEKPIVPASVEKVIISCSGNWMATIDSRDGDVGFHSEVYLKIWSWDENQENWVLNTRIDRPHGIAKVTDLNFSPDIRGIKGVFLVTTGNDGRIKTWKLKGGLPTETETKTWVSYATLTFRSETPTSISWSPDSSLFAVSVGRCVAIYQAQTSSLCQTLTSPDGRVNNSSHFIGGGGRYLLASASESLVLWDLVDSRVIWQCNTLLQIDKVVPHQKDATFAAFHLPKIDGEDAHTQVSIFTVSSSSPTTIRSVPFGLRSVVWAPFQNDSGFNFVGITHLWKAVVFGDCRRPFKDKSLSLKNLNMSYQLQSPTLFQDIFGVSAFASVAQTETLSLRHVDGPQEILDQPAHSTPPLNDLFDSLIKLFLRDRPPDSIMEEQSPEDFEHDEMQDVQSAGDRLTTSRHHSRPMNPGEMTALTELFRSRCITAPGPTYMPQLVNAETSSDASVKWSAKINKTRKPVK